MLVVNHGLKMGKGKIAAQVGHASIGAMTGIREEDRGRLAAWLASGQRKVCVKGNDAEHLLELSARRRKRGSPHTGARRRSHANPERIVDRGGHRASGGVENRSPHGGAETALMIAQPCQNREDSQGSPSAIPTSVSTT